MKNNVTFFWYIIQSKDNAIYLTTFPLFLQKRTDCRVSHCGSLAHNLPFSCALRRTHFKTLFIHLTASVLSCGTRMAPLHVSLGFSLVRAHGLSSCGVGSVVVVYGLSYPVTRGILVFQSEIKSASPVLEGRFLTTRLLGKSQYFLKKVQGLRYTIVLSCTRKH